MSRKIKNLGLSEKNPPPLSTLPMILNRIHYLKKLINLMLEPILI